MPAFSRGAFLLRLQLNCRGPQNVNQFYFISNIGSQSPRKFSTSSFLRAAKKIQAKSQLQHAVSPKSAASKSRPSQPTATKATTPTPATTTHAAPAVYQTYATTLAQKANPTLLYQAPGHAMFIFSSYSAAAFFFSYAGINWYSNYLFPPEGLDAWVPIAFGGICIMMGAFGGWLLLGPAGIVKSITAVPHKAVAAAAGAGKKVVAGGTATAPAELRIEVELRKMFPLPFFPARRILAKPEEVVLFHRLAATTERKLSPAELRALRVQEEEEKRKRMEYERSHILTAPFRHASMAFYELFRALRQTWTREGFTKMQVKGRQYKLDVSGGWALDDGRAIDRLVTIKPRPGE